jgi:hypothetical protein
LFVSTGMWLRLKKIRCSGSSEATTTSRSRSTSAVKLGTETVRVDLKVFGWPCWRVGLPAGDTIVPQIRTVAGVRVTSTSHLRMARTSPIRELCGVPDKERDLAAGQQRRAVLAADSP